MLKSLTGMDGTLETIRQIRSAGRMNHQRTHSATTIGSIDDNASVSSNFNSATKRRGSKSPNVDYSGLRAAAGVSRMKHGRLRRGSAYPNDITGVVDSSSAKGRRTSILTISDVGIKMRRRRRNTTESWGKNRTRGEIRYFDKVYRVEQYCMILKCGMRTNYGTKIKNQISLRLHYFLLFSSTAPSPNRVVSSSRENRSNVCFTLPVQVWKVSLPLNKWETNGYAYPVFWLNWSSLRLSFRENEGESLAHTVFTQYINENENHMEAELAFDASFFKANRKVSIHELS